jgi:hypothetical protein
MRLNNRFNSPSLPTFVILRVYPERQPRGKRRIQEGWGHIGSICSIGVYSLGR